MFRRRDEEENVNDAAYEAANSEAKNTTTNFGNFMENKMEAEKKEEKTTARSLFGVNAEKKEAVTTPLEKFGLDKPAEAKEEAAAPKPISSIFSKPANSSATQAKPATYKLSAGGAVTSSSSASSSSTSSNASSSIGASSGANNMDKIETEKRLTVGYGITLEGKISNCDKLIVYGFVNADLTDVKTLHISESGKFSGFAAIENAEISGAFEGDLIVENSIVINSTGKMSGKVTYGSIEIKPGGKFTGQIVDASDLAASGGQTKAKRSAKKDDSSEAAKNQEEFTLSPEPVAETV